MKILTVCESGHLGDNQVKDRLRRKTVNGKREMSGRARAAQNWGTNAGSSVQNIRARSVRVKDIYLKKILRKQIVKGKQELNKRA